MTSGIPKGKKKLQGIIMNDREKMNRND